MPSRRRRWAVLVAVAACACGSSRSSPPPGATPDGAAKNTKVAGQDRTRPERDDEVDTRPTSNANAIELTGTLIVEGTAIDLATEPLRVVGTHCTDGKGLDIEVMRGEHGRTLWIRAEAGDVELGETVDARSAGSSTRATRVDVFADVSVADRAASATLPEAATVRFDAWAQGGPIDLTVDADFGAMGQAQGRIRLEATRGEVCTRPPPPPPTR